MKNDYLDQLIDAHFSGVLSAEQRAELEQRLLHSAADRERFWQLSETHMMLHELAQQELGGDPVTPQTRVKPRWFAWRPLTAAAAGLAFGMLCTTALFAYTQSWDSQSFHKILPLVDAGFESTSQVPAHGIPAEPGTWSGDFSQVVVAENGIAPHQGQNMLRFLRADNETSLKSELSYVSEVSQVIDLRALRAELTSEDYMLEVSAMFNAITMPANPSYEFSMKAATFRGDIADAPSLWKDEETGVSRSACCVNADADTSTWQRVVVPLLVPQDADYIVINCAVVFKGEQKEGSVAEFAGHYVDQVEARLSRSSTELTKIKN